ncbi:HAD family hydrolase [Lutibacter holmesii]|uniref:HAD family hydrolase n=1 Tax=Lutibacter holmesii TaxID=1137985 RepID=A0ABW3WQ46_9FLAO
MKQQIDTIIFDLGGVLVDWNPTYLYQQIFKDNPEKMAWFLNNVCTPEWNLAHDAGQKIADGEAQKIAEFPEYETEIRAFYTDWEHMFKGTLEKNVALFKHFKASKDYRVFALTNWSAEKWDKAIELFPFFNDFDGVVVSGQEKCRKPSEKIFQIIFERFQITPEKAVFIDDNKENIEASNQLKLNGIHFQNHEQLLQDLKDLNIKL